MEQSNEKQQFEKEFLAHLQQTYSAQNQQALLASQAWLSNNTKKPFALDCLLGFMTSFTLDEKLRLSAICYLKMIAGSDMASLIKICRIFQSPIRPRVAKSLGEQLVGVFKKLKEKEICDFIKEFPLEGEDLVIQANVIMLVSAVVDADVLDEEPLGQIYEDYVPTAIDLLLKILRILKLKYEGRQGEMIEEGVEQTSGQNVGDFLTMADNVLGLVTCILSSNVDEQSFQNNILDQLVQNPKFQQVVTQILFFKLTLFSSNLTTNPQLPFSKNLNSLKANTLLLANRVYQIPLASLFEISIKTLRENGNLSKDSFVETILSEVLVMVERYSLEKSFYQEFVKNKVDLIIGILGYCVANEGELELVDSNPVTFVDMGTDFCEQQDMEIPKTRASSLLGGLCLNIDGVLSCLIEVTLKLIHAKLNTDDTLLPPRLPIRVDQNRQLDIDYLLSYPYSNLSAQQVVESCLLAICSVADQIYKRKDLQPIVTEGIKKMGFKIVSLGVVQTCRFILFLQYFPDEGNLQSITSNIMKKPKVIIHQITNCFINVLVKHKRSLARANFLTGLSLKLLKQLPCLNETFNLVVMQHFEFCSQPENLGPLLEKIMGTLVKQCQSEPSDKRNSNVNRLCLMLCNIIKQMDQPAIYQKLLFSDIISLVGRDPELSQDLINISTIYVGKVPKQTEYFEVLSKLLVEYLKANANKINRYTEFLGKYILVGGIVRTSGLAALEILLQILKEQTNVLTLFCAGYLTELIILQINALSPEEVTAIFNIVANKLSALTNAMVLLTPRLLLIHFALIFKHSQVTLPLFQSSYSAMRLTFIQFTSSVCLLSLEKSLPKRYAIYLMKLLEFDLLLKQNPEQIFVALLLLLAKIDQLNEQKNPYSQALLPQLVEISQKEAILNHPFNKIDVLANFRQAWQTVAKQYPQIKESTKLDKELMIKYLQNQIINEKARRIVKIKR